MKYITVITIGVVLWYILGVLYLKVQVAANHIAFPQYDIYRGSLGLVLTLIGILVEWETLLKIWKQGRTIRVGLLFIAISIIIFTIIPYETIVNYFGIRSLHSLKGIISLMHESAYSRSAASILGGILLVKSFKKSED